MAWLRSVSCVLVCYGFLLVFVACDSADEQRSYLAPFLDKHYKLSSSDQNFDVVLKELGVGAAKRNAAKLAKPVITLTEDSEGVYTLKTHSKLKDFSTTFSFGKEFEHYTVDGRKVMNVFTQDKNVLTEVQKGQKTLKIVHEFFEDKLTESLQVGDIVTYRVYKPTDDSSSRFFL